MKKTILIAAVLVQAIVIPSARATESFAQAVVSYTAGLGVGSYTDPTRALGKPSPAVFGQNFSPFNPHFATTELARIGEGGQLTLQLANFVIVTPTAPELGIWENVGLADTSYPNGHAGATASVFGADSALIEVSEDNVTWYPVNGGAPVLFTLPGNYFANSTGAFASLPPSPVLADFGKPFTGALSSFDGKDYAQILTTLDGSAGGTWLDLDSTGLTQVGFVRFSGVANGQTLEIDAVGINGTQIGAAVPEPASAVLLGTASLLLGFRRRRGVKDTH